MAPADTALALVHNHVDVARGADLLHHPGGPVVGDEGFAREVHAHDGEAFGAQGHVVRRAFVPE